MNPDGSDTTEMTPAAFEARLDLLTPRTRQVAVLLAYGADVDDIAAQLGITRHTVLNHIKLMGRRLGVSGKRAQITAFLVFGLRR